MNDISFTPYAAQEMNELEPNLSKKFEKIGFKFNAGVQLTQLKVLTRGIDITDNNVVISNALVIALGLTSY